MKQEKISLTLVEERGEWGTEDGFYIDLNYHEAACIGCGKTPQTAINAARRSLKKLSKMVDKIEEGQK